MKKINLEQGTQNWINYRRNGVGASDIANIAEIKGAFKTRRDTLLEKLGIEKPLTEFQKKMFQAGHEWEKVIRESSLLKNYNFIPAVVECETLTGFFASLDGIDEQQEMILEVKSVTNREKFEEYKFQTPPHYMAQVQWQMFCTGYKRALIAYVFDGEVDFSLIESNGWMQAGLLDKAEAFLTELNEIKSGQRPMPVQSLESADMERLEYLKRTKEELKQQIDMIDQEADQIAEKILMESGANKVENAALSIAWQERKGSIAYAKIPEVQKLGEAYLNSFRSKDSKFIVCKLK